MRHLYYIIIIFIGLVVFVGCANDDILEDIGIGTTDTTSVGVYVEDNQWVYSQMKHHYLWYEDLPDSLSCNYLLDPVSFFKSLLSPKDRFSYCEHNSHYDPSIRKANSILNPESVIMDSIYYIGDHRIGYLCYRSFDDTDVLESIFKRFYDEKINDMVLDLRYNGGGYVSTCQYLCSSIVPDKAYGHVFEYLHYNDIVTEERVKMGKDSVYYYWYHTATDGKPTLGTQLYGLRLNRLFVLVSGRTASASESTIVCLKPYMDVITIGERTIGKGVGMETLSDVRYKYQLVPITFRYYNADGESVPDKGIEPDYPISGGVDIEKRQLGQLDEPYLHQAIHLIVDK